MKLKEFMSDTFSVRKGAMKINTKGIIESYREKYDRMMNNSSKRCRSESYSIQPGGRVILHIKVPSETVDNFFYDVLFELTADKSAVSFADCDIRVFSNCPSFVYSVAYVFAHWDPDKNTVSEKGRGMMIDTLRGKLPRNRMLIPGTENKLGRKPVHEAPIVRNPMGLPLFDKSIYFAIFYMNDNLDFSATIGNHNNITTKQLFDSVAQFDHLMNERKKMAIKEKRKTNNVRKDIDRDFERQEKNLDRKNIQSMMRPKASLVPRQSNRTSRKPRTMKSASTTRQSKRI